MLCVGSVLKGSDSEIAFLLAKMVYTNPIMHYKWIEHELNTCFDMIPPTAVRVIWVLAPLSLGMVTNQV